MIYIPPTNEEIEVSLFGPGVGECVVAHIGHGKWIIIDSCKENKHSSPIALEYLTNLGVNYDAVELVVISHWHNDHINGAYEVISECQKATFSCPLTMESNVFATFISALDDTTPSGSKASEISKIFKHLTITEKKATNIQISYAYQGQVLYENQQHSSIKARIMALSPSSFVYNCFLKNINHLSNPSTETLYPYFYNNFNHHSIVLHLSIGINNILLGGDLPSGSKSFEGWKAVLNIKNLTLGKSKIFKVSHHGSHTSYLPSIWNTLIEENPIAVMTPKLSCQNPPPTADDITNIKEHSNFVYCTCSPKAKRGSKIISDKIERELSYINERKKVTGKMGHVRVRFNANQTPTEEHVSYNETSCRL